MSDLNGHASRISDLHQRRDVAMAQGGKEKISRQHQRGKLTARDRVALLLDPDSFQEYGLLATHQGQKSNEPITPADALVAGLLRSLLKMPWFMVVQLARLTPLNATAL